MKIQPLKKSYFTDAQGNPSLVRMGSLASLIGAIMFGAIAISNPGVYQNDTGVYVTLFLLAGAFGPKTAESFRKNESSQASAISVDELGAKNREPQKRQSNKKRPEKS